MTLQSKSDAASTSAPAQDAAPGGTQKTLWESVKAEIPFFVIMISAIVTFRVFLFDMNFIPSESMQPTLEVGDRIVVNKFAYGYSKYSFPFSFPPSFGGKHSRVFGSIPDRGDVVTFKHPKSGVIFIKRVVGHPGDRIRYDGNRLYVNNDPVPREKIANFDYKAHKGGIVSVDHFQEQLADGTRYNILERFTDITSAGDRTYIVPEGHLFVMGDNRDNSRDSRELETGVGYLPIENVVGRAERVLFSTYRCKKVDGLRCAKRHLFGAIR